MSINEKLALSSALLWGLWVLYIIALASGGLSERDNKRVTRTAQAVMIGAFLCMVGAIWA